MDKMQERLILKTIIGFDIIPCSEVLYIKSNGNYVLVFTTSSNKSIIVHSPLKAYDENKINLFFVRCHKCYVVNILQVRQYCIKDKSLILGNKAIIPVSDKYSKQIKQKLESVFITTCK